MHDLSRRLDLNLLRVFDALYRHRTVVGAADELAISPSACSHALKRLRDALQDDLFARYGAGMQPTARADHLAPGVSEALEALAASLGSVGPFKPQTSRQTFVLAATDFTAFALLPTLVERLSQRAPRVRLEINYTEHRNAAEELAAGRIHFALGFSHPGGGTSGVEAITCFEDSYVAVHRPDHPRVRSVLDLEAYLAERHIVVAPWADEPSVIDAALQREGHRREIAVRLPSVLAAPFIAARSDHLLTVPRRVAEMFSRSVPLQIAALPFNAPSYRTQVFYHRRYAGTAGNVWLKAMIESALVESGEAGLESKAKSQPRPYPR
ncbi:LysR family transcriptional regulator [Stenotrophomonas sp. PS02298]|uniref:LysR family transcriptional regulator n=1 Tax=Stenotrophomonas sp. PS02298 TaxID=2991424 RepID=UPI00249A87F4|nr:LysR family transcriptional regulator [Stenotrophomonas sp. PS02298]